MNLLYLEFIGAVTIDRTPAPKIEPPVNDTEYHYLDVDKLGNDIESLEKAVKQAKKEQADAIRKVYNDLVRIVKENDSSLRENYLRKKLEKYPVWVVNDETQIAGTDDFARGDICFEPDKIILFMNWFTVELLEALKNEYTPNIMVYKGILTRDPMEIHLDMTPVLEEHNVSI